MWQGAKQHVYEVQNYFCCKIYCKDSEGDYDVNNEENMQKCVCNPVTLFLMQGQRGGGGIKCILFPLANFSVLVLALILIYIYIILERQLFIKALFLNLVNDLS